MPYEETELDELMKSLTDNFNVLADEVQLLSDRKTILEHKLRFAHEQYQHLADKYAPSAPEISNTLAKLQLPPELKLNPPDRATFVPLPRRSQSGSKQQTAEAIRDGRSASKKIASLRGWRNASDGGDKSTSGTSDSILRTSRLGTSATSAFEQDFTIPGKKSELLCPFAAMANRPKPCDAAEERRQTSGPKSGSTCGPLLGSERPITTTDGRPTVHSLSADPICAALYSETHQSPPPSATGSAAKCPIRFLDQHSPEEVARYFETHKHEIPRSHEVCVKRYQRNEEDIRKLDAKYGNLVSMISGLGQKHQPMLQVREEEPADRDERKSNERVQNWAKAISANGVEVAEPTMTSHDDEDDKRETRFDRPMKEIRVGESPSRPWGISVPFDQPPLHDEDEARKPQEPITESAPFPPTQTQPPKTAGKCPFDHCKKPQEAQSSKPYAQASEAPRSAPAFFQQPDMAKMTNASSGTPQMVFTGPVFIGYPVEQAMALMQQWQAGVMAAGLP